MNLSNQTLRDTDGHLSLYRMGTLSFPETNLKFKPLLPIWSAMRTGRHDAARSAAQELLRSGTSCSDRRRAAIEVALAHAEYALGALESARRHANRSIALFPKQIAAHRVILSILSLRKDFAAAYAHLDELAIPRKTADWDETISRHEYHLALAAYAWQMGNWENVNIHLERAFPKGVEESPAPLHSDWFRLALYRDDPGAAAAVASIMIEQRDIDRTDELLQTIVGNGWTKQALPLYRRAFEISPQSELLRRRLVALCIREGQLDEARRLTGAGALRTAA